jgi:hypothetical protein
VRTPIVNHFEEFDSGELHEKHTEATWSLEHFPAFAARRNNSVPASYGIVILGLHYNDKLVISLKDKIVALIN